MELMITIKFAQKGPTLSGVGGGGVVNEDTTCFMNIKLHCTNKIVCALKFELIDTEIFRLSKSHLAKRTKKVTFNWGAFFLWESPKMDF